MTIIPRRTWGALRQARLIPVSFPAGSPLIVHHSAGASPGPNATARQDYAAVRGIDRFHYYTRGWSGGVGYNYLVSEAGRILEGRGRHSGAHTIGHNNQPAVCLIGDYRSHRPNRAMRAAVWELADHLGTRSLVGHRHFYATTCPGDAAMAHLVNLAPLRLQDVPRHLPHGGSLRLAVGRQRFAGWDECRGPLQWIDRHGLEPGQHAIAWRGNVWRGARDVTNVARHLVREFLS